MTVPSRAKLGFQVNGENVEVPRIPHRLCPNCGESLIPLKSAIRLQNEARDLYRKRHRLLFPEEIRAIRESLSLSQAKISELLTLGANTFSRWESGRIVQSASMDTLLRLVRDIPQNIQYLHDRAA
jgi:putative zinc finger/helix-turn-helix YgiT family protein